MTELEKLSWKSFILGACAMIPCSIVTHSWGLIAGLIAGLIIGMVCGFVLGEFQDRAEKRLRAKG